MQQKKGFLNIRAPLKTSILIKYMKQALYIAAIVTEARKSKELEIFLSILRREKTEIDLLKRQGETRIWELLGE
ncbi:hypothetical protein [Streptococcus sobrinus]|uniref:hypothetical protein n=1 Tax=Streptococcus sobrinus TaxID=1310 RepID=UPI00037C97DF|nr:hypothetical protein [Streptococcus sobrinus]